MTTNRFPRALAAIALLSAMALTVAAAAQTGKERQPDFGVLFGTVYDGDNRPVYGVRVKIRRAEEKKARWELMSDHSGEFAQRVPAGDYVAWAEIKKSKGKAKPEARIRIENGMRSDISLHLTE